MRGLLLAGVALGFCALLVRAEPAAAMSLGTSIDLDYTYAQDDLGGDVNAETLFNQKYEVKYESALTQGYDFLGAVRLELQNGWYTDAAGTSKIAPTLELEAKGSQASAKFVYEAVINTTDTYRETQGSTAYSTSLSLDVQVTPVLWPEMKLKFQRRNDFQDFSKDSVTNTFEFSAKKDIYGVLLEYAFKREDVDETMPSLKGSTDTRWSNKATYKEILWGGTEFELAYEITESYKDENTRGVFSGETQSFTQALKTRARNSLVIAPRLTLKAEWEYQYDQDLLALDYDYKVKNKYLLDMRWDAYPWLKFSSELRRETEQVAAAPMEDDEESVIDTFKAAFDYSAIPWMLVTGKAEFKNDDKIAPDSGGSVDTAEEEKYELVAKNKIGDFWDFTWDATTSTKHTDGWKTDRETRMKGDLKLKLLDLGVAPSYEVSRKNTWERPFAYEISQEQVRDAKIKFDYQMQLLDLFKATFSHEYGIKVGDTLDEVLNFERTIQFAEDTRINVVLAELLRDLKLEGEVDRKASDTQGDADPELVELAYSLKLDWKYENLSVFSSLKYNDKGNTFDDVSFNAKATWKGERLEISGEYQFDKIIKDVTEPKDEKRKLNLKLNYRF